MNALHNRALTSDDSHEQLLDEDASKRIPGLSLLHRFYPESRIGNFSQVDVAIAFYLRVNSLIQPDAVVLDAGCGRGAYSKDPIAIRKAIRILRGKCKRVIGIDPDSGASANPYIDEFRLMIGDSWPVEDECVNLIVADSVLEHVGDPAEFLSEACRVLRKGGYLCLRTPNLFSYFGLASVLIPARLHAAVLRRMWGGAIEERDVFPTLYKCNTRGKLRRAMTDAGFDPVVYGFDGAPVYLIFSRLTYFLGTLYQRLAPNALKVVLFAFGRKQ